MDFIKSSSCPSSYLYTASSSSSSSAEPSGLNVSEKNTISTEGGSSPRFFIGLALTFGFTLMFVVDQIGNYCSMHGKFVRTLSISFANILYVFQFVTTTCAMSHFRPNNSSAEQCRHHSHIGAGYSCCRYSIIQNNLLYISFDLCLPKVHNMFQGTPGHKHGKSPTKDCSYILMWLTMCFNQSFFSTAQPEG